MIHLGQYLDKKSIIHRLDPRVKLFSLFCFSILLVSKVSYMTHIGAFALLIIITLVARIEPYRILRIFKNMLFFLIFAFLMHLLFTPGELSYKWWIFTISKAGAFRGVIFSMRLFLMIWAASIFGWVTRPVDLADSMEIMFDPLSRLGIPVRDMSTVLLIGMRFIPAIFSDAERIQMAQKARGLKVTGNLKNRILSIIPLIVPLFASAFNRADTIALALESKGYRSFGKKTYYTEPKMTITDYFVILFGMNMIVFSVFLLLNRITIS